MPNQTAKGTYFYRMTCSYSYQGTLSLLIVSQQATVTSNSAAKHKFRLFLHCEQHCVKIQRLHKCKEHCFCLSSKSSEETLTWTPVLYFQPHFALNVNLMHPWFHCNCKEDKYFEITLHHFYCFLHLPQGSVTLERVWKMESRWLVILALQVKEMIKIYKSSMSWNVEFAAWTNTFSIYLLCSVFSFSPKVQQLYQVSFHHCVVLSFPWIFQQVLI